MTRDPKAPQPNSADANPRPKRRWMRGVLGLSLGVNVLVIGLILGVVFSFRGGPGGAEGPGLRAFGLGPIALAMEREDRTALRWVQFDGGTDAVTQMMGGQLDVVSTDLGEIAGFVESGDIRILAALSTDPIPAFPDIPTAKSLGIDVTGYNWRGLYTGGNVSDEAYNAWVEKLETLYNSDEWQTAAVEFGLVPIWIGGADFEAYVREQEQVMAGISRDIGIIE